MADLAKYAQILGKTPQPKAEGLFGMGGAMPEVEEPTEEELRQNKASEVRPLLRKEKRVENIKNRGQVKPDAANINARYAEALKPKPNGPDAPAIKGVGVPGQHNITGTDIVNFIAGGEMAVIGMKMDNQGLSWEWENMKQQWSEEPLWLNLLSTTSLVGTMAFPAARAALVTAKFGQAGKLLPKMSVPLLGKVGGVAADAEEITRFNKLGMLDSGTASGKTLRLLRQQEHSRSKYLDLASKMELDKAGELKISNPIDKLKYAFDKRFANSYYNIATSFVEGTSFRSDYINNLDKFFKSEDIGRYFVNMPDEAAGKSLYQHHLHMLDPNNVPMPKLSSNDLRYAEARYGVRKARQTRMLEDGFIDEATYKHIGEAHLPAMYKDTPIPDMDISRSYLLPVGGKKVTKPGAIVATAMEPSGLGKLFGSGVSYEVKAEEGVQHFAIRSYKIPRLDSDTLKMRKADVPEVYRRLQADELITDPADLTVRGDVMSELLHFNFKTVRDIITNKKYSVSDFDIMAKYGTAQKANKAGYISFENVGDGIANRLKRMLSKKGVEFKEGERLPWVRKEVFDEIFGDSGMFAQSVFGADMMELATIIHKSSKTGLSIPTHFQNLVGNFTMLMQAGFNPLSPDNIKIQSAMVKSFNHIAEIHRAAKAAGHNTRAILDNIKVNFGNLTIDGKTFDLNKELLDPMVRELIEESAFETTEGFAALGKVLDRLKDDQYMTKTVAKIFLKTKSLAQMNDKKGLRWFDQMTKWYLGEDMVPKMSYFMKLRAQGLTKEAAVLEVGRRLPMYATVGSGVKFGRKFMWPWASFPTEALRITKNNIMDNPLRMAPWLHMPSIMQSVLSAVDPEVGSPELVEEAKRQLPMYGQKPTTVVSSTETAAGVGGGVTGAITGAVMGGMRGGPIGAAVGGVLGGYGGKKISQYFSDSSSGDVLRGSILNFLPHSSFFLTTNSPDFTVGGGPAETLQQLQEQLPAEPLAILKPLIDIAAGKTSFGADIGAESLGDQVGKGIAGFMGFLAPPWIQKYGLKTTTPDVAFTEAMFGRALPGDISNVSRGLIDIGISKDPSTGRPGNLSLDFLLGNFGMWRSYSADPKIQLANEVSTDNNMEQVRTYHAKNLDYHLQNGEDEIVMDILTKVQSTFAKQYADNPTRADSKYGEWLERFTKSLGKHPKLRRWSEDELKERRAAAQKFSGEVRGQAREAMLKTIRDELTIRRISKTEKDREGRGRSAPEGRSEDRGRGLF